ncbi:MAG TPA: hypothetical protein VGR31_02255 [Planctomycetota bacterium]|nr:hypothetical protein [Planctomycetota bacterium]
MKTSRVVAISSSIGGLVLVVLLGAATRVQWPHQESTPSTLEAEKVLPPPAGGVQPDTSTSEVPLDETYTSSAYGFGLRYPKGWLIDASDKPEDAYVHISNVHPDLVQGHPLDQLYIFQLQVLNNPSHLSLKDWIAAQVQDDPYPPTVISSVSITVGGQEALINTVAGPTSDFHVAYVPFGGHVLFIEGPSRTSVYAGLFTRMLDSVSFRR